MSSPDRTSTFEQAGTGQHSVSLDTHVQNLLAGNIVSLYELGKSHIIAMEEVSVNVPMIKPSPDLLAILKEMGTEWEIFTVKEVTSLLKDYIIKQNLYSPEDPRIVSCDKDPLSKALGVKKFTLFDAKKLIEMNCYPLPDFKTTKRQQLVARPKTMETTNSKIMQFITISCPKYLDMKVYSPELLGSSVQSDASNQNVNSATSPRQSVLRIARPSGSTTATSNVLDTSNRTSSEGVSNTAQGNSSVASHQIKNVYSRPQNRVGSHSNAIHQHTSGIGNNLGQSSQRGSNFGSSNQNRNNLRQSRCRRNPPEQCSHRSSNSGQNTSQGGYREPRRQRQASLSINYPDSENGPFQVSLELQGANSDEEQDGDEEVVSFDVDADRFQLEYEVVSDDDDIISSTASVSGISESNVVIICGDSDMEFWADSSENEMIEEDKWICTECGADNLPLIGRCSGCSQERPGWLSESSKRRRLERSSRDRALISSSECEDLEVPNKRQCKDNYLTSHIIDSDIHDNDDSGIGTLPSSQESVKATSKSNLTVSEARLDLPLTVQSGDLGTYRSLLNYQSDISIDGIELGQCQSKIDKDLGKPAEIHDVNKPNYSISSKSESKTQEQIVGKCIICFDRPKNASIIHGCTGHQACCYRCAKKLKRFSKPCPICRRPIQKIIRNFIAQ